VQCADKACSRDILGETISKTATKRLVTYDGGRIAVVGETKLKCVVKNDEHEIPFKVID
jgi:hypothetical protein